jgi:hypothetical protein
VAEFGGNLDRHLGGAASARAAQMDAGGVFWRWLWTRVKAIFN